MANRKFSPINGGADVSARRALGDIAIVNGAIITATAAVSAQSKALAEALFRNAKPHRARSIDRKRVVDRKLSAWCISSRNRRISKAEPQAYTDGRANLSVPIILGLPRKLTEVHDD